MFRGNRFRRGTDMKSTTTSIVAYASPCALAPAFALLAAMSGASAADLPARTYVKAPVEVAAVSSWTGFYAGAAIGWAGYRDNWTTDRVGDGTPAAFNRLGL